MIARATVALLCALAAGCGETHTSADGALSDAALSDAAAPVDADVPDAVQFCTYRETYMCARDLTAGRIDMAAYNMCAGGIDARCSGFAWRPGCAVTRERADACITAVSDARRIDTLTPDLPECMDAALCGP